MNIADAQREIRTRFLGGFYGQLVSGVLWLAAAAAATWSTPRTAITLLVVGGFFIFPLTESLIRLSGTPGQLSGANTLPQLGMQVAFVLPLSMPLLAPIASFRLTLFFPAMMVLLGAHYVPFVFLYGMRMFGVLAGLLIGSGVLLGMYGAPSFASGAWLTGGLLILFAGIGRSLATRGSPGAAR
ncbi:MAG: hypothetical protein AB7L66_06325 [Gemmatimonadales bacterium]